MRQLVITLSGKLDFQTRGGQHFILEPGEILLAEDTTGGGHSWKLVNDEPWRRLYVVLGPGAAVPFKRRKPTLGSAGRSHERQQRSHGAPTSSWLAPAS